MSEESARNETIQRRSCNRETDNRRLHDAEIQRLKIYGWNASRDCTALRLGKLQLLRSKQRSQLEKERRPIAANALSTGDAEHRKSGHCPPRMRSIFVGYAASEVTGIRLKVTDTPCVYARDIVDEKSERD